MDIYIGRAIKYFLGLMVCVMSISLQGQAYLDYAKIHVNLNPMSGYNMAQANNGDYYVVENYISHQSDLDPDEVNTVWVYDKFLSNGLYLAKYNKNGEYLRHTFMEGGAARTSAAEIAVNDSFVVMMGEFYDSVWLYGTGGKVLKKKGKNSYLAMYNNNLELVNSIVLATDSGYIGKILFQPDGKLLIYGNNKGTLTFNFNGDSINIEANNNTRLKNTWDAFFLRLDNRLNYEKHVNFGVKGSEGFSQFQFDDKGNFYVSGYIIFSAVSEIMGVVYPISSQFGNSTSPIILKYDANLNLIKHTVNNLKTSKTLVIHPNGNLLWVCSGSISSQLDAYYLSLLDSNFNLKFRYNTNSLGNNNNKYFDNAGFVYKDGSFALVGSLPLLFLKDTTFSTSVISVLLLSNDSLQYVNSFPLNNAIIGVFYIDTVNILTSLQFNGEVSLQKSKGNGPPFMIGDRLYPTKQYSAVCNYRYDCTPVTTHLQYDTQSNCAENSLMGAGRGNVRLIYKGSGAAFQWYNVGDTTFKLSDQESPIQGGQSWRGTKSSYLKYSTGASSYIYSEYVAKVGGSCTDMYLSDTAVQMIWGKPLMIGQVATKFVNEGASDSLVAYLQDTNYPIDSLEFQWYRGATAIIDGFHFKGARSQKLYINNIKPYDDGLYTCVPIRIHCSDYSSEKPPTTYLRVKLLNINYIDGFNIKVFPNPVVDELNIETLNEGDVLAYEIYDAQGKMVLQGSHLKINVTDLNSGLYVLKLTGNNHTYSTTFIKN